MEGWRFRSLAERGVMLCTMEQRVPIILVWTKGK